MNFAGMNGRDTGWFIYNDLVAVVVLTSLGIIISVQLTDKID